MNRINNYNKAGSDNLFHFNDFSYPMKSKEIKKYENIDNFKINVNGFKSRGKMVLEMIS